MTARRITCMTPAPPPAAASGTTPRRQPATPRGNPGDAGAKRTAVQHTAVPAFDAAQHILVGVHHLDVH